jgi:hypothetical protein
MDIIQEVAAKSQVPDDIGDGIVYGCDQHTGSRFVAMSATMTLSTDAHYSMNVQFRALVVAVILLMRSSVDESGRSMAVVVLVVVVSLLLDSELPILL